MNICNNCDFQFETPERSKELMGEYWGAPAYETIYRCPCCGSDDFEKAEKCAVCGEYFISEGDDFCEKCKEELSGEMHKIKDKYGIDLDTLQDWICALYEW